MLTFRVLAALLSYPTPELKVEMGRSRTHIENRRYSERESLAREFAPSSKFLRHVQLDAESCYLEAFDRGRSTSLYLFEHIHGESRDRGQAMVRVLTRYRMHGLDLSAKELPDFLPLFLEFLSTCRPVMRESTYPRSSISSRRLASGCGSAAPCTLVCLRRSPRWCQATGPKR